MKSNMGGEAESVRDEGMDDSFCDRYHCSLNLLGLLICTYLSIQVYFDSFIVCCPKLTVV